MTQSLSKYHARAPRYILQPQDNTLIRVAGPRQVPWEEATDIQNISLSGLAFTAPPELCPIVGEFIKIQFEVPGSAQMACYGLVTRLETMRDSKMLVGVQFRKLELPQRIVLAQALAIKLKSEIERKRKENRVPLVHFFRHKKLHLFLATVLLVILSGLFYVFSTILSST